MKMTREQFVKELSALEEKKIRFVVESEDSGSVFIAFYGCEIKTSLDDGIGGEIIMIKPHTEMEVRIDFDIVDAITKEGVGSYRLEMNNGMSDIVITNAE